MSPYSDFESEADRALGYFVATKNLVERRSNELGRDLSEVLDYFVGSIYLRLFGEWENFLETVSALTLLCRVPPVLRDEVNLRSAPPLEMSAALQELRGGQEYMLWHNPASVVKRLERHFTSAPVLRVIRTNHDELLWYSSIRHALAHRSSDAQQKFAALARANQAQGFTKGPARTLRSARGAGILWITDISQSMKTLAREIWPEE